MLTAAAIAGVALRARSLTRSGAVAAGLVGVAVLGFGGLAAGAVLIFFFTSSSALSQLPGARERSRRDVRQVVANGSVAAVAAALTPTFPVAAPTAFLGALGAAAADTWATEIGVRFGGRPRSLRTFKSREPGASGAVSLLGTAASGLGAVAIGGLGWWLLDLPPCTWAAVGGAGFLGALVDSALGDSVQAVYHCSACGANPEVARHEGCLNSAERTGGIPGLDNDVVNWITTLAGAVLALAFLGACWQA